MDFLSSTRNQQAIEIFSDKADLDVGGDLEHVEDEELRDEDGNGNNKLQNENKYNKLLPYNVTDESKQHFMRIKASLAKCIQLDQEATYDWFIELEKFIDLYGLKFYKSEHIYLVKLHYKLLVSKSSTDLYYIAYVARSYSKLMRKRFLISNEELQLDWRPLYNAYKRLLCSNTEVNGLRFVPEILEPNLSQAIRLSRPHFTLNATQEMLDEWRPLLCPYSSSMKKVATYLSLFLPTTLPPQHHDKGFKLWFEEILDLWLTGKVEPKLEIKLTLLLSRLASDCLGFIDWSPYIPRIFNHLKANLNLSGRAHLRRLSDIYDSQPCVLWMVYMIGPNNGCLDHIASLFKSIESYYHPSNSDRRWSYRLKDFLYKLPVCYVNRIYRERYKKNVWSRRLPDSFRLTDEQTTKFVDALMPVVLTSMFNKTGKSYHAATAFRDLAVLRPEKVVPPLLERLYGSYETLTVPERLLSSINCVTAVIPAMVKPCKFFPEGPNHVVPLLLECLPGIDSNDMGKCIAVFRFVATLAAHIRIEDFSHLVDECPDLTYEQQQLCLASRQFEEFVLQFLDKCFVLIENTATALFSNLDQEARLRNGEEGIVEEAISSVSLSILTHASPRIKEAALDKLYHHITGKIFNTRTQGKAVATLCLACAKSNPESTLKKFIPHFCKLILTLTDNEEVFSESTLDEELSFSLLLISEIVRCYSSYLLIYKDLLISVIQRSLKLRLKEGYLLGCKIYRYLLRVLTSISCNDYRNFEINEQDERLPFEKWGHTTHIKELKLKWDIPSEESRQFAQELLEIFLKSTINELMLWKDGKVQLTKEQVHKNLQVVFSSLYGAASVLPTLKSEAINLCPGLVPLVPMYVMNSGTEPLELKDGTNVRTWIVETMLILLDHINVTNEDDTKSASIICEIFSVAISYFGYNKTELRMAAQRIKSMKNGFQNKLLGSKRHLRYLLVERVMQQHRAMLLNKGQVNFTKLHLKILERMFQMSQSHYHEVRIIAQDSVYLILNYFPFSENILVPMIVKELQQQVIEHKKFKGLLYLLVGRRSFNSIMIDPSWSRLKLLWSAVVDSPYSEKLSIGKLLDKIWILVEKGFDTFALKQGFSDDVKNTAKEIWTTDLNLDTSLYQEPDKDTLDKAKKALELRDAQNIEDYESLCVKLSDAIDDDRLHWHRRYVALGLFVQLLRDDHPLPLKSLSMCLSSLISERLDIRTKALSLITGQLILHKRKSAYNMIKIIIPSPAHNDNSAQANLMNIKEVDELGTKTSKMNLQENVEDISASPKQQVVTTSDDEELSDTNEDGDAKDSDTLTKKKYMEKFSKLCNTNKWLQYKLDDDIETKDKWDSTMFIDKPYIGFYQWPKKIKIYDTYAKQPQLNRPVNELNEYERMIYEKIIDKNYAAKLVEYLCFEEQKSASSRSFNARAQLWCSLFKNYGPCIGEPYKKYVSEYTTADCEYKQRFVIEFLAGMIRGSRLWSFEMMQDLREFVLAILNKMTIRQDNFNDWIGFSDYVFSQRDARRFMWLLRYLVVRATDASSANSSTITPFIQASRLGLAHYAMMQCEWRVVENIFPIVIANLLPQDHLLAYNNVRNNLASVYSLIYMFDDQSVKSNIAETLNKCPKRIDFINFLLPRLVPLEKSCRLSSMTVKLDENEKLKSVAQMAQKLFEKLDSSLGYKNSHVSSSAVNIDQEHSMLGSKKVSPTRNVISSSQDIDDANIGGDHDMKIVDCGTSTSSPLAQLAHPRSLTTIDSMLGTFESSSPPPSDVVPRLATTSSASSASITSIVSTNNNNDNASGIGSMLSGCGVDDGAEDGATRERKDAMKLMKLTASWVIYMVCRMRPKSSIPADFFKLLPMICEMGREANEPDLAADALYAVTMLGNASLSREAVAEALKSVRTIIAKLSWHARVAAASFMEFMVSSNLFVLLNEQQWRAEIEDIVINKLIIDERVEVRESSAITLSGMIHCEFTKVTQSLIDDFTQRANEPLVRRKQPNGSLTIVEPRSLVVRHSGILCLCACVEAHPYTVPDYLPGILILLSDHFSDPQPISTAIKKTMSNFRRTHHDNWQKDKEKFTNEQLSNLTDLLISPSYYA